MTEQEGITRKQERRIRWGQTIRVVTALAAIVFLAVFALVNSEEVQVDYAFGAASAPMIVVIIASAFGGFVLGLALGWRRSDRQ